MHHKFIMRRCVMGKICLIFLKNFKNATFLSSWLVLQYFGVAAIITHSIVKLYQWIERFLCSWQNSIKFIEEASKAFMSWEPEQLNTFHYFFKFVLPAKFRSQYSQNQTYKAIRKNTPVITALLTQMSLLAKNISE